MRIGLFGVLLVGCGPTRVGGVVDGEAVGGARDAFFDTVSVDVWPLDGFEILLVVITDLPNGCEVYQELLDTIPPSCEERCDDYLEAMGGGFRRDTFWTLTLAVNTSDGSEGSFEGVGVGTDEFVAGFAEYDAEPLHDPDACEEACRDGDLLQADEEGASDGELEIDHADDDIVRGRLDVSFGSDDGLAGVFTARACDLGGWVWPF